MRINEVNIDVGFETLDELREEVFEELEEVVDREEEVWEVNEAKEVTEVEEWSGFVLFVADPLPFLFVLPLPLIFPSLNM